MRQSSRNIEDLILPLQDSVHKIVDLCKKQGVDLLVYQTFRSLEDQALLFCKTRTVTQVNVKVALFRDQRLDEFADALEAANLPVPERDPKVLVKPRHVTMAAPGESWHNYGEAIDAVPTLKGKPLWGTEAPEWQIYGRAIAEVGWFWAGEWKKFKEFPHAQHKQEANPLRYYSPGTAMRVLKDMGVL